MKLDFSSKKVFTLICILVVCLMLSLFFWRINEAEGQLQSNIDERVTSASLRIAHSVLPLVYNIYQKSTERHFTQDTASAILDAELNEDFIVAIKVYGNFGHLFMGKYKNAAGELIQITTPSAVTRSLQTLNTIRTPVKQGTMTIGNIEVYYSYGSQRASLNKVIFQELLQIALFTFLILLLFYLIKKTSIAKNNSQQALSELKATQGQLIKSEHLLKEANLNLEDKVNARTKELKIMNEQLVMANQAADSANKAKSLFLANMSHEIRTPMNGVIGLTELLLRTELSDEQRNYLTKLKYSSNNLLHIINDILDFSKIEAGKFTIEQSVFDFRQMLDSVVNIAKINAANKALKLTLSLDETFPAWVLGDSVRCAQILSNLLSNALKFTEQGSVTVAVQRHKNDAYVHIKISDTGIGISQEQQEQLFSAFTQADASTSRKYGGTGLGLVICKHLINLMQGEIQLQSELGKGSCFSFNLYLPEANLPLTEHHHDAPADDNNPDDNAKVYISERLKNKKTLLVEDIAINRLIAQSLLEQAGLLVECAENGLEATKMAQLKDYDLIIMDIQMPVMDGFEATKIIRGYPQYRDTPIVAMTANALSEDQDRSLAAGMNSHLTKPMQYEEVIAELERYF
tara:strand:- start:46335 stop:48227 length:1893 start_codon:yes stop_codon:yes gene_type:complete